MQFGSRSISERLLLGFGLIIILLVALCIINVGAILHQGSVKDRSKEAEQLSQLTRDAEQSAIEANMHLSNYLLSGAGSELDPAPDIRQVPAAMASRPG
jgi:CHASE3 domain sensor protein